MTTPATPFQVALATRKLRLEWACPRPAEHGAWVEQQAFALACALHPARPQESQDELLRFEAWRPDPGGGGSLTLQYVFDRDWASQYEATETWTTTLSVDARGRCTAGAWAKGA